MTSQIPVPWPPAPPASSARGALGWALLVSLLLHLVAAVSLTVLRSAARNHPDWLPEALVAALTPPVPAEPARPEAEPSEEIELPLEFIEVDPALATAEPPPESRLYSTANTRAANPNPPKAGERNPFVDGWDEEERRTFRVERATVEPPVPATARAELEPVREPQVKPLPAPADPPRVERPAREAVEAQPAGGLTGGETQLARVEPNPVVPQPQPARPAQPAEPPQVAVQRPPVSAPAPEVPPRRNRSVREARESRGLLVGEKMKQDGGVDRFQLESSLDVRSSPFADYDRQFIYAVQQRWYQLLDEHHYSLDRSGKVILKFRLQSDGTIAEMTQVRSDVGEIWAFVCESAVLTPSPYARWPSEMRRLIGADFREVTFTFRYY